MNRATVLTFWQQVGRGNSPYLPPLQTGESWTDITGTPAQNLPTDTNGVVVEVLCSDATLDALEADEQMVVLTVEEADNAS